MKWFSEKTDVGAMLAKRQFARAIKVLDKQLREDPESVSLRLQLADAYERDGQKKQAIAVLAGLLERDGEDEAVRKVTFKALRRAQRGKTTTATKRGAQA